MTTTCDQCDNIPGIYCPACNPAPTPPAREPDPWSRPFQARFGGQCTGCGFPIVIGENIRTRPHPERDGLAREARHDNPRCLED